MKITFKDEFELEFEDTTYSGTLLSLTRKQIKDFKKKFKDEALEDDSMYKARLELSMQSDNKIEIMSIGETYNYRIILETILQDIDERKAKN